MNIFFHKNSNKPIFWTFHIISFIFFILFDLVANKAQPSFPWIIGLMNWFLFATSLRYIYRFLFPKPIPLVYKILIIIILSCTYGVISYLFLALIEVLVTQNIHPLSEQLTFLFSLHGGILHRMTPYFAWSLGYWGLKSYFEMVNEKMYSSNLQFHAKNAQLQMLRYQINPHFLFNSLYSIKALTYENIEKAGLMITELADFLRATLKYNDKIYIPIKDEIEIIEKYLIIEKIRFEERLNYKIEYSNDISNHEILCFITQPLVENAIKHGLDKNPDGININVKFVLVNNFLEFRIENEGSFNNKEPLKGTGIVNVKERLESAFSDKYFFNIWEEDGKVKVILKIPINV